MLFDTAAHDDISKCIFSSTKYLHLVVSCISSKWMEISYDKGNKDIQNLKSMFKFSGEKKLDPWWCAFCSKQNKLARVHNESQNFPQICRKTTYLGITFENTSQNSFSFSEYMKMALILLNRTSISTITYFSWKEILDAISCK